MKSKILSILFLLTVFVIDLTAQTARNIPRDSGPVDWTVGNVLTFIVFPIFLVVFLFFYIKKLTREKLEEKEEKEKGKTKGD